MTAALFDPDDIMRAVRAKANPSPPAKTANPLKRARELSNLTALAGHRVPNLDRAIDAPIGWGDRVDELISSPSPEGFPTQRWAVLCNGVKSFAEEWAAKATSLGWTFEELFALCDPFANVSLQGAAWFVGNSTVTAVTADAITLRTQGGATQRTYRGRAPRG